VEEEVAVDMAEEEVAAMVEGPMEVVVEVEEVGMSVYMYK
jgi:hypothetical protein